MSGPSNAVTNDEGLRFYVFGEGTEQEERFISVTSVLKATSKDGLIRWASALSADAALDNLGKLITATRTRDCGNTFKRCQHDHRTRCVDCPCDRCTACLRKWLANRHYYESSRRATEGGRVHDVIEWWVLQGGELPAYDPDVAPYVAQFLAFVTDFGLSPASWLMAEATVINRAEQYAGTLDGILVVDGSATPAAADLVARILKVPLSAAAGRSVTVMVDGKTREKEEARLYAEYALQLAAYRNAAVVRINGPDGVYEAALPDVDGAVVLQLRPDGYLLQPVVADELTYTAFLALAAFARWEHEYATASVSSRSFPVPKEPAALKLVKPAPRKSTHPTKTAATTAGKRPAAKTVGKAVPPKLAADTRTINVPLPLGDVKPRMQSATLASAARAATVDPRSPRGDNIPF